MMANCAAPEMSAGTARDPPAATIAFPAEAMHSFSGGNNRIVWTLHVKGDIPFWPDVSEEFEIEVQPRGVGGAA